MPLRLLLPLLLCLALFAGGCKRSNTYSQATPDDVLKSAAAMVKNNETRRLTELIYADSVEMRALLRRLGTLMQNMQELSKASAQRWPDEFQKVQDDAAKAAADPKNQGLIAQFMAAGIGGRPSAKAPNADDIRAAFSAFLADPYGWLDRGAARLTTSKIADDMAVVLLDGQPAIPVIGLTMKLEGDKWYVVLPTSMAPISGYMPRTKQQWSILGSCLVVLDNAVRASTDDVRAGKVMDIRNLTDKFQDKVLIPLVMAVSAYGKELDVAQRIDRRLSAFRKRQDAWATKRREAAGDPAAVSPKVLEVGPKVAFPRIEEAVRASKAQKFDELSEIDFEALLTDWWKKADLALTADGDLSAPKADPVIAAWLAEQARIAAAKVAGKKRRT